MNNRMQTLGIGLMALGATAWLTGCACTTIKFKKGACLENEKRGYGTIVCQPLDTEVLDGEAAVFKVQVNGTDVKYQWYFQGIKNGTFVDQIVGTGTTGGETQTLTVTHATPGTDGGQYYCEIESMGPMGQVATRTRNASLGFRAEVASGGGGVQTYNPQQASTPMPKTASNNCGTTHCTWVGYQNGGAGFDPDPNLTKAIVKVRIGSNFRDNTTYQLRYMDNMGVNLCAGNSSTDIKAKEFTVDPNRIYFFTVYLAANPQCVPQGTTVFLEVTFTQ